MKCGGKVVHRTVSDQDEKLDIKKQKFDEENIETLLAMFRENDSRYASSSPNPPPWYTSSSPNHPFQNNSPLYTSSSSSPNPLFQNNSPWYTSSHSSPNPPFQKLKLDIKKQKLDEENVETSLGKSRLQMFMVHHRTVSDEDEKVDIKKQKLKLDIKKQKLDEENVETSLEKSPLQMFMVHHRTVSDEDEKLDIKKQKLKLDIKKQKLDEENVETSSRLKMCMDTFENKEIFADDYYEQEDGSHTMTFEDLDSDQLDMIENDVSTYPFLDEEENVQTLKRLPPPIPPFQHNGPWYTSCPWYTSSSSFPNPLFPNSYIIQVPNRTQLPQRQQPYTTPSSPYMSTNGAKTYTSPSSPNYLICTYPPWNESQPPLVKNGAKIYTSPTSCYTLNSQLPPEIQPLFDPDLDPKAVEEYVNKQREISMTRFKQLYPGELEDMEKLNIEVQNSEGFDVSIYPNLSGYCGIITRCYYPPDTPVSAQTMEILTSLAVEAINHYNSQEGTNYTHDVTVIKAMISGVGDGLIYYLTFQAFLPDSKNSPQTFEAKVFRPYSFTGELIDVQLVRLKKPN